MLWDSGPPRPIQLLLYKFLWHKPKVFYYLGEGGIFKWRGKELLKKSKYSSQFKRSGKNTDAKEMISK